MKKRRIDPAPRRVYFGETPFAFAASMGCKEIVKILLDHAETQGGPGHRYDIMTVGSTRELTLG